VTVGPVTWTVLVETIAEAGMTLVEIMVEAGMTLVETDTGRVWTETDTGKVLVETTVDAGSNLVEMMVEAGRTLVETDAGSGLVDTIVLVDRIVVGGSDLVTTAVAVL